MFKRKEIFCAALCLAAVLLLGACTSSADVDDTVPPEESVSSPVSEGPEEGSTPSPAPESTPASEAPGEEDEPSQSTPTSETPGEEDEESPDPSAEVPEEKDGKDADPSAGTSQEGDAADASAEGADGESAADPAPGAVWAPTGGVVVPARAKPVDDSYFDDAAFIGNSLVDGFRLYSGLNNCDYYAKTSMTILGIGDYITQMSSIKYGKVYMLLGINELTYDLDALMRAYSKSVDRIRSDHPGVLIYVMSVSPVSAKKDASGKTFTMANVRRFNERLLQMAEEKGCYYIDLCDAMGGDDGFLPADITWDGIHFEPSGYKIWLDYLRLHYIPVSGTAGDSEPDGEEAPETDPEERPATDPEEGPAGPASDPEEGPDAEPEGGSTTEPEEGETPEGEQGTAG